MMSRKPHSLAEVFSALLVNNIVLLLADPQAQNAKLAFREVLCFFLLSVSADLSALFVLCVSLVEQENASFCLGPVSRGSCQSSSGSSGSTRNCPRGLLQVFFFLFL